MTTEVIISVIFLVGILGIAILALSMKTDKLWMTYTGLGLILLDLLFGITIALMRIFDFVLALV